MKKTILAVAIFAAMATGAMAAPQSSISADQETIVVSKAADLLFALTQLNGQEQVVGQGASQHVATVPYNFSADTTWIITDNITALRRVVTTYQDTVKSLTAAAQAKNGGPLKPAKEAVLNGTTVVTPEVPSAAQKALVDDIQKLFDSEKPVAKLFRLKRGDLKLGENKIPPSILSSLSPILDR